MKTSRVLHTRIVPPRVRYFADGDVVAPPAPVAPPAGGPPQDADLMAMDIPDINGLDFSKDAPIAPVPTTKPPVAPPAPKPPEPPAPKSGDKPPVEPPANLLRKQLEDVKAELAAERLKLAAGDPKLKELERERDQIRADMKTRDERIADYERRLALADPAVVKELSDLDTTYSAAAGKFFDDVPEVSPMLLNQLTRDYHALPFGKDGYREARAEFEAKVNLALGGTEDKDHRKLGRTLDFIDQNRKYALERPVISKKVHENALSLQREAQAGEHSKTSKWVEERLAQSGEVPEELASTDPFHPRVALKNFAKNLPPETVAKVNAGIDDFVKLVFAGDRPFDPKDYAGMTEEQIRDSREAQRAKIEKAKGDAVDVLANGLRALRYFPGLVKELARLRDKAKEGTAIEPPDPTKPTTTPPAAGDDLKTFVPPDLDKVNF